MSQDVQSCMYNSPLSIYGDKNILKILITKLHKKMFLHKTHDTTAKTFTSLPVFYIAMATIQWDASSPKLWIFRCNSSFYSVIFPVFFKSNIAVLIHFNIPLLFWNNFVWISCLFLSHVEIVKSKHRRTILCLSGQCLKNLFRSFIQVTNYRLTVTVEIWFTSLDLESTWSVLFNT